MQIRPVAPAVPQVGETLPELAPVFEWAAPGESLAGLDDGVAQLLGFFMPTPIAPALALALGTAAGPRGKEPGDPLQTSWLSGPPRDRCVITAVMRSGRWIENPALRVPTGPLSTSSIPRAEEGALAMRAALIPSSTALTALAPGAAAPGAAAPAGESPARPMAAERELARTEATGQPLSLPVPSPGPALAPAPRPDFNPLPTATPASPPVPAPPASAGPASYLQVPFDNGRLMGIVVVDKPPSTPGLAPLQLTVSNPELGSHLRSHAEKLDFASWELGREQGSSGHPGQPSERDPEEPDAVPPTPLRPILPGLHS